MELLIIACLILLNGILAMSELAVVSSKKIRLEAEAQQGNRLAAAALKLVDQPERFLSTIQVGITLIGILTGLFSADVLSDDLGGFFSGLGMPEFYAFYLARILVVAVVTYLTIVFGELVPKRIGMCAPEVISKLAAVPMKAFSCVAAPFVWVLSKSTVLVCNLLGVRKMTAKVTEEEIRLMVQESARDGDVQDVERKIVERVFNLGDRCNAPRHLIELRQVSYITCLSASSVQGVCIDSASPLQAASRSPQSTVSSSSLTTPSRSILSLASASRCITLARSLAG